MNLPSSQFLQLVTAFPDNLASPELESMILAWDHITDRYLKRLATNRILAGRVRSVRVLAVHDAVLSILDPGYEFIFKPVSSTSSTSAALAATAQAAHDVLTTVFNGSKDVSDLDDLLSESLALIGNEKEKLAGSIIGAESAAAYIATFSALFLNQVDAENPKITRFGSARHSMHFDSLSDAYRQTEWRRRA